MAKTRLPDQNNIVKKQASTNNVAGHLFDIPGLTLENVLEDLPLGILIIDNDHSVRYANREFINASGTPSPEAIKKKCYDLFPSEHCHTHHCPLNKIKSGAASVYSHAVIKNAGGDNTPYAISTFPLVDSAKKTIGTMICFKEDCQALEIENREKLVAERTEQLQKAIIKSNAEVKKRKDAEKKASREKQALQELLDATPAGIYLVDRKARLKYTNKAGIQSIGKPLEEILGKTAYENHPEREHSQDAKLADLRVIKTGVPERTIFTNYEPLHERWFTLDRYPFRDSKGNISGVIIVEVEITDRINIENQLKKLLEQEQSLKAELKEQSDQRIEFTRALVHELKTPLTPLLVSSDYLADNLTEEPYLSFARNIQLGANNLSKRINELLDIARGEVGILKVERKHLYPRAFLKKIYTYMLPEAERNGLNFNLVLNKKLPLIFIDAGRIQQVLLNLLNNAFKFTRRNGTVSLKAEVQNNNVVFEVEDTGCGISQETQKSLFKPYSRQKNGGEALGGLGLGLFLSKMLVELHGGKIWVESTKGKGSRFFFSMPIESQDNNK